MADSKSIPEAVVVDTIPQQTLAKGNVAVLYAGNSDVVEKQRKEHQHDGGIGVLFIRAGTLKVDGSYMVPKKLTLVVVLSGAHIDLSRATFLYPKTVITCLAVLGGVRVTLPPNVNVEVSGLGILGAFKKINDDHGMLRSLNAPTVVLKGCAVLGAVKSIVNLKATPLAIMQ